MNKKTVFYYRVSTVKQGESGLGLEAQRETVTRYASSQGMETIGEFTEIESGKVNERPQLTEALAICKKTGATLVVSKLDRLSRNAVFLLQLQNAGVEFICTDCPNVDRFTVGILALVAQREREMISERTKAALKAVKARGVRLGNPNVKKSVGLMVAGARIAKENFNNGIRPVIEEVRDTGVETLQGIADCLNRRGIFTRNQKMWRPQTVKRVLA